MSRVCILVFLFATLATLAAGPVSLSFPVGGLAPEKILNGSGEITLREPDGPRGQYKHGFRTLNDSAAEWQDFYGVQFEIRLPDARKTEITAGIFKFQSDSKALNPPVNAAVRVSGKGWHTVTLPWSAFDNQQANTAFLKYVKEFRVAAKSAEGSPVKFQLRNARCIKAPVIALLADVCGKAAPKNGIAEYEVTVGNCTQQKQAVALSFVRYGWQAMGSTVEPNAFELEPGEMKNCRLHVTVPENVPPGGHEEQVLQAIGNGDAASAAQLKFITTSELPHPYIMHTAARWLEVRDKVAGYDWAKAQQEEILRRASNWKVPEVADPAKAPDDTYGPYIFATANEADSLACAYAWQLVRDTNAAQKVALFLRRLSTPTNGYPVTLRACNQSLVQEGGFF